MPFPILRRKADGVRFKVCSQERSPTGKAKLGMVLPPHTVIHTTNDRLMVDFYEDEAVPFQPVVATPLEAFAATIDPLGCGSKSCVVRLSEVGPEVTGGPVCTCLSEIQPLASRAAVLKIIAAYRDCLRVAAR